MSWDITHLISKIPKNLEENKLASKTEEQYIYKDIVHISRETTEFNTFHVHLDTEFGDLDYFRPLQSIFSNTTDNDTIVIHLTSNGGSISTAIVVYGWMMSSEAHTVVVLEGISASAASFFVMGADSVIALPHSSLMLHPGSYGSFDTHKKMKSFVDFHDKWLYNLYNDLYEGFLSPEEIETMIEKSEDIWMSGDEVIERLQARLDAQEDEGDDEDQNLVIAELGEDVEEIIKELKASDKKPRTRKKKVEEAK